MATQKQELDKSRLAVFIVFEFDRRMYIASYGIAGIDWVDSATYAYRFETYESAQEVIEYNGVAGMYQILI